MLLLQNESDLEQVLYRQKYPPFALLRFFGASEGQVLISAKPWQKGWAKTRGVFGGQEKECLKPIRSNR